MRLFVGLAIPDDIVARIEQYVQQMQAKVPEARFVRPETLHITLKFIGESNQADEIRQQLATVQHPSFAVDFRGVGFFTPSRPRIFYAAVDAKTLLQELAAKIDAACSRCGIHRENKTYNPHLTLARSGSGNPHGHKDQPKPYMRKLREAAEQTLEPHFGTMTAQEFILYRSHLSPKGARYEPLASFSLGAA
jgi:2'-5' RNA ligase